MLKSDVSRMPFENFRGIILAEMISQVEIDGEFFRFAFKVGRSEFAKNLTERHALPRAVVPKDDESFPMEDFCANLNQTPWVPRASFDEVECNIFYFCLGATSRRVPDATKWV